MILSHLEAKDPKALASMGLKILENLLHSCDTEEDGKKSVLVSSLFSVN